MNKLTQKFLLVSALALAGCDTEANRGRLVGFIVDGQTGQRLNFFQKDGEKNNLDDDSDSQSQVYAVIDGEFRRAKPCDSGDLSEENSIEADGCYQIEDIPEGMTIPIFAQLPGYERFIGEYTYELLVSDVEHAQKVANIRLFPKGYAMDYRFNVSFSGRPVPNAQVICQYLPASSNSLQVSGEFLTPKNTGTTTVSATSGEDGVAVIPGAQLVNGANYHCETVLSQALDGRTLAGQGQIIAGVSQAEQRMALSADSAMDSFLYAVRSNVDDSNTLLGGNGKLVITFNRPVEIVPGTANCQTAAASIAYPDSSGTTGELYPTEAGNNASEQVITELSGDGLTLTIGFNARVPFEAGDLGTTISFNGIVVRPRSSTDTRQTRSIGDASTCPAVAGYNVEELENLRTGGATQSRTIRLF